MSGLVDAHDLTDHEKRQRAERMHAMYSDPANPVSMAQVGAAFGGLTKERVRQIFAEYGLPIRTPFETRRAKRERNGRAV